jgi:hypothetical protein
MDDGGASNSTGTETNAYPDQLPIFVASITPADPSTASILSCNLINWSDADNDLLNSSSISYRWFNNNSEIGGETTANLTNSSFVENDTIVCEINASAQAWTTSHYITNSTGVVIKLYGAVSITITYPVNSTAFVPGQCWFLTIANITYSINSTNRTALASLYLDNIYQTNISKNITLDGLYNFNFTGLIQTGNYSVVVVASDSLSAPVNSSVWATLSAMASCIVPNLGITTKNMTYEATMTYAPISVPYVNISQLLSLVILGLAIFGMVHYSSVLIPGA